MSWFAVADVMDYHKLQWLNSQLGWACWHMLAIRALRGLGQEGLRPVSEKESDLGGRRASAGWVPDSLSFPGPPCPAPPGRGNYIPNRLSQALSLELTHVSFLNVFLFLSG